MNSDTARTVAPERGALPGARRVPRKRLHDLPPIRHAVVVGAGSWGTAVAALLARGGVRVRLGCRTAEQASALDETRRNERYLPGVRLPETVEVRAVDGVSWHGVDLVCLAVPARALPAALSRVAEKMPERAGVIVLSKGLVAPSGDLPAAVVGERLGGARPLACLGGPAHALEAVTLGAELVVATIDARFGARLTNVLANAGLACKTTADVLGVQLAGCAKNAAALGAGTVLARGANAAGAAAGCIWEECWRLARARGAEAESFAGLAGTGDLVATVLAPGSRNRRAGELLAGGTARGRIAGILGQVPEALDTVALLAEAMERAGIEAPATASLAALVEGRIGADTWLRSADGASARWEAA